MQERLLIGQSQLVDDLELNKISRWIWASRPMSRRNLTQALYLKMMMHFVIAAWRELLRVARGPGEYQGL